MTQIVELCQVAGGSPPAGITSVSSYAKYPKFQPLVAPSLILLGDYTDSNRGEAVAVSNEWTLSIITSSRTTVTIELNTIQADKYKLEQYALAAINEEGFPKLQIYRTDRQTAQVFLTANPSIKFGLEQLQCDKQELYLTAKYSFKVTPEQGIILFIEYNPSK